MGSPREILKTQFRSEDVGTSSTELARVFTDEDDHAIVQQRLGLLYGALGAIVIAFYVMGVVLMLAKMPERFWEFHRAPAKIVHLLVGPALVAVGLVCRRPRLLPRWLLSTFDVVGLAKLIGAGGAMVAFAPPTGIHPELLVLPAMTVAGSLRAALVPSPPRWSALVVALASISTPYTAYLAARGRADFEDPATAHTIIVTFTSVWALITVFVAYLIARVVYGLRAEVKNATRLGQYTLEQKIGEGGMGVVYRASHALLRRPTAIKLLSADRAGPHEIRRFEREVQLTSMLTHPNTVAIYDFGHTRDGVFYYAMEHLEGLSLHDLVERDGAQPPARVIHILGQIAGALSEAHATGLVHRDVKPANVFLCERGGLPDFVKVLDFGLVKRTGRSDPALSRAGAIAGTPHYMAPESILEPETVDARVDIYALGAVGYYLLTGTTPFQGNNLVEICSHHLHSTPEPPSSRTPTPIGAQLESVILACLEKRRDDRPATAAQLLTMLQECEREHAWDVEVAREWWARERRSWTEKAPGAN